MSDSNSNKDLKYLRNSLIAAKLMLKNTSIKTKDDKEIDLRKCNIKTDEIEELYEYLLRSQMPEKPEEDIQLNKEDEIPLDNIEPEKIQDRYVIPIVLPNGEEILLEVQDTQDDIKIEMICYDDNSSVLLIKQEIIDKIEALNVNNAVSMVNNSDTLFPNNLRKLAESISKSQDGSLVPQTRKELAIILGLEVAEKYKSDKDLSSDIEANNGDKTAEGKRENKEKEDKEDKEVAQADNNPEQSNPEQLINSRRLVQIVEVKDPSSVKDKASKESGIKENGGEVTLFRFSAPGATIKDIVVLVQGGRVLQRDSANDEDYCHLMTQTSGKKVEELKDKESKIIYTDKDGKTTICDMVREPNDLSPTMKKEIEDKLRVIDDKIQAVRNNPDLPEEEKIKAYISLNNQRTDIIVRSGLAIPIIERKMALDLKELENRKKEEAEKPDKTDEDNERYYGDHVDGRTINPRLGN